VKTNTPLRTAWQMMWIVARKVSIVSSETCCCRPSDLQKLTSKPSTLLYLLVYSDNFIITMPRLITLSILLISVTNAMATCLHTFQNCGPGCYNKDNLVLNGGLIVSARQSALATSVQTTTTCGMLASAEAMLIKTKRSLAPYVMLDLSVVSPLKAVFFAQRVSIKSCLDNSTAEYLSRLHRPRFQ
jgi:dolichyl-phosphate-mannose--protein O-mannosyl transferase